MHRHHLQSIVLEYLGHAKLLGFGMLDLEPQRPAALAHPAVELVHTGEAVVARIDPDAPMTVLHVLVDDALLRARGDVAEVGVVQR